MLNALLLLVLLFASVGVVMGLASLDGVLPQLLLYAYYVFLVVPLVSIIGSWIGYHRGDETMSFRFVALTWEYLLLYAFGWLALFFMNS